MINVLLEVTMIVLLGVIICFLSEILKAQKNVVTVLDPKYKEKQLIEQEKHLIELQEQVIELGERKELLITELTSLGNTFEKIQNSLASTINVHSNETAEMKEESTQTKITKPITVESKIKKVTTATNNKVHLQKDIKTKEMKPHSTEVMWEAKQDETEQEGMECLTGAAFEMEEYYSARNSSHSIEYKTETNENMIEANDPGVYEHFFGDEDVPHDNYA